MRHPEHDRSLEEDWLFEAITESYVPLLLILSRLKQEGLPCPITIGLTPTLCAMLRDPLLRERCAAYLERTLRLAGDDLARSRATGDQGRESLARFYLDRLARIREAYLTHWRGDLVGAFKRFQDDGEIEIMASAATHGLLPALLDPAESHRAVRAQIEIGCRVYRDCFGRDPRGFWLPECAYAPELEPFLREAGVQWFVLEAHGLSNADPLPANGLFKPCRTPEGIAVFGRDPDSSRQVWSAESGYPGAPEYREFYRDLGHELPLDQLGDYLEGSGLRRFTGLKYRRITGRTENKELYDPAAAARMAGRHAAHFARERATQLFQIQPHVEGEPVVVCAFDAELFGHWWFEGIAFLESFVRQSAFLRQATEEGFALTTPSAYLARNAWLERIRPAVSSWGMHGHLEAWLSGETAWIYPHLHEAARRLAALARHAAAGHPSALQVRCLNQMTRELLLAQSSDWAFLMQTGTARHYAEKRTRDHLHRFHQLFLQLTEKRTDETFLRECEARDAIFADVDWRVYARREAPSLAAALETR